MTSAAVQGYVAAVQQAQTTLDAAVIAADRQRDQAIETALQAYQAALAAALANH